MDENARTDSPLLWRSAIELLSAGERSGPLRRKAKEERNPLRGVPVMDNECARMHGRFSRFTPVAIAHWRLARAAVAESPV